ncbi:MAG: glycosyltransferase family 4 protein [Candidatus Micrarchaeia archaeon]
MKILMLNPFFYPYQGGTEKHILEVGKRLVKRGFDVTVLTTLLPHTKPKQTIQRIKVVRVNALLFLEKLPPLSPVPPPIALTPRMSDAIKKLSGKFDWVHIHNRFFYSPQDAKNVKEQGVKLAMTLHNAKTKGISPATDFLGQIYDEVAGKNIMKHCNVVAAVSTNTRKITVPKEFQRKSRTIYNGVNMKSFKPSNNSKRMRKKLKLKSKKILLTVCRLTPQKGLNYLLRAMKKIVAKEKNAHLVILGVGNEEKYLKKLAKKLQLNPFVTFLNKKIPEKDLTDLYAACDLFVLPSTWEPFGMVLCEAMATKKPVIGTRVGGIPEIIEDKKSGLLIKPKSPHDIAFKALRVLQDKKLARQLGTGGYARVKEKFTWNHTASGYEKLYSEK